MMRGEENGEGLRGRDRGPVCHSATGQAMCLSTSVRKGALIATDCVHVYIITLRKSIPCHNVVLKADNGSLFMVGCVGLI